MFLKIILVVIILISLLFLSISFKFVFNFKQNKSTSAKEITSALSDLHDDESQKSTQIDQKPE